jgi:hypothetical protein
MNEKPPVRIDWSIKEGFTAVEEGYLNQPEPSNLAVCLESFVWVCILPPIPIILLIYDVLLSAALDENYCRNIARNSVFFIGFAIFIHTASIGAIFSFGLRVMSAFLHEEFSIERIFMTWLALGAIIVVGVFGLQVLWIGIWNCE